MTRLNPSSFILLLTLSVNLLSIDFLFAQQTEQTVNISISLKGDALGDHPRGLIKKHEVSDIRARAGSEPFSKIKNKLVKQVETLSELLAISEDTQAQDITELAANQSYLYLLTGEREWAEEAFINLTKVFEDSVIFNNPVSRGLTRAAVLQKMAFTYDFCFEAWTQEQRNLVNGQLYKLIYSTSANMGFDANYNLVSNWMGVRWGSVLFASLVWDNPNPDRPSIVQPLLWDAQKRLSDHLERNVYPEGWSAESIGYHIYNWSFVGPALIAFQNQQQKPSPAAIQSIAPQLEHAVKGIASTALNIETSRGKWGIKPDLPDDGLNLGDGLFSMALRLYPSEQIPLIKWMHDYLKEENFYSLLYYRQTQNVDNPEIANWLNFSDSTQGVVTFRNRYRDDNDIVAVFNTSNRRVAGHKGPDVNTFRILGLGVPWIIGGGRTNLVAGQTNLFPGPIDPSDKGDMRTVGKLVNHSFQSDGSGEAVGIGSSMGVEGHVRKWMVDYSGETGAAAVFVISDWSENGKVWRINTPEFIDVKIDVDGFRLTAPNGASMQAHFFGKGEQIDITSGRVRYGGETIRLNTGILFQGNQYAYSKYVDLVIDREVVVIMTMQPKGLTHPIPNWNQETKNITLQQKVYDISLPVK